MSDQWPVNLHRYIGVKSGLALFAAILFYLFGWPLIRCVFIGAVTEGPLACPVWDFDNGYWLIEESIREWYSLRVWWIIFVISSEAVHAAYVGRNLDGWLKAGHMIALEGLRYTLSISTAVLCFLVRRPYALQNPILDMHTPQDSLIPRETLTPEISAGMDAFFCAVVVFVTASFVVDAFIHDLGHWEICGRHGPYLVRRPGESIGAFTFRYWRRVLSYGLIALGVFGLFWVLSVHFFWCLFWGALALCIAHREATTPARNDGMGPASFTYQETDTATIPLEDFSYQDLNPKDGYLFWGDFVREDEAPFHFLASGTTGAGKSTLFKMLMRDALRPVKPGVDSRALIFDPKSEIIPYLAGLNLEARIFILNPLDARSLAWDMAHDIGNAAMISEFVEAIVPKPDNQDKNTYFVKVARQMIKSLILALHHLKPGQWTLRDIINGVRDKKTYYALLKQHREAHESLMAQMQDNAKDTAANHFSTIQTNLQDLSTIAACWYYAAQERKPFSLEQWVNSSHIFVLGYSHKAEEALKLVNRLLLKKAHQLSRDLPDSQTRRTWYFLDELPLLGGDADLHKLMTLGRSKGCCVALGFQSVASLEKEDCFGEKGTIEVLGQVHHKALLRVTEPHDQKYCSDLFGEHERHVVQTNTSINFPEGDGKQSTGQSTSGTLERFPIVMPSKFRELHMAKFHNHIDGYYLFPQTARKIRLGKNVFHSLPEPHDDIADFIPRPDDQLELPPWTPEERLALNLPPDRFGEHDDDSGDDDDKDDSGGDNSANGGGPRPLSTSGESGGSASPRIDIRSKRFRRRDSD